MKHTIKLTKQAEAVVSKLTNSHSEYTAFQTKGFELGLKVSKEMGRTINHHSKNQGKYKEMGLRSPQKFVEAVSGIGKTQFHLYQNCSKAVDDKPTMEAFYQQVEEGKYSKTLTDLERFVKGLDGKEKAKKKIINVSENGNFKATKGMTNDEIIKALEKALAFAKNGSVTEPKKPTAKPKKPVRKNNKKAVNDKPIQDIGLWVAENYGNVKRLTSEISESYAEYVAEATK